MRERDIKNIKSTFMSYSFIIPKQIYQIMPRLKYTSNVGNSYYLNRSGKNIGRFVKRTKTVNSYLKANETDRQNRYKVKMWPRNSHKTTKNGKYLKINSQYSK